MSSIHPPEKLGIPLLTSTNLLCCFCSLPYTLHTNVTRECWQKSLESNELSSSKFMFYDESSKSVFITHLPTVEHERTCHSFVDLMATTRVAYGLTAAQGMKNDGSATTLIGQEADAIFTPRGIAQPGAPGHNIPFIMNNDDDPYPTLVVEIRVFQSAPRLQDKIAAWLGPNTTVQLLLKVIVRRFSANQAGPRQWRMEATLYQANPNRAHAPIVLQGPIEFGQVGARRAPLQNPCNAVGQHILNLPMNLLYWGVPAAQVPNIGATWDLDLYDLQQLILL